MPTELSFFLDVLGENLFPCLFQLLEIMHIPGLGSPSTFKTSNGWSRLSHITWPWHWLFCAPFHVEGLLWLHWAHSSVISSMSGRALCEQLNSGIFLTLFVLLHENMTWCLHCFAHPYLVFFSLGSTKDIEMHVAWAMSSHTSHQKLKISTNQVSFSNLSHTTFLNQPQTPLLSSQERGVGNPCPPSLPR